jgi:hypothetical protein
VNALLGMFERIGGERGAVAVPTAEDPAAEDAAARQRQLRDENMELSALCRENDGRLGELADDLGAGPRAGGEAGVGEEAGRSMEEGA